MQPSSPCGRAVGGSQYRDDQFPRKTGEIDSARSHMNVSAIFPFTSAIIRRASRTPSLPSPSPGSILCSLPSALVLLCIDNASVHRSGKSFHASSSLLRSSFSFYSTREWWEMLFFFFLMISFYRVSMIFMWYVWREFDGWKIGVEKEISDRGLFVQLTSFRGLNSRWIKT